MRVYVTGASGFVGHRLLPRLAGAGHVVIPASADLDITRGDILDAEIAEARPDAAVHLAAQSSVADSRREPASCFRVNYLGTRNLIHSITNHAPGARLLLVGSADEYETTRADANPWHEDAGLRPESPYARTKAAAELLGGLAQARGLDVVRTRSFNHTGRGQDDRFVASSFARQIAEISLGRREPEMQVGNLESVRDFLDVEDVVDAYLRLLDPAVPADVYNIASGAPIQIEELLGTLIELAGVDPVISVNPDFWRRTDQLVGDATRLREATGWRPQIPLRETLGALLAGWQDAIRSQ
jgi:GDP-4-dehydro-6-deoxy-D-mannose reductase